MPRVFLTPFVIAGLLFLPSCSSAEAKVCEAAKLSYDTYYKDALAYESKYHELYEEGDKIDEEIIAFDMWHENYKSSQLIIVNYAECFTPKQVVEAEIYLEKRKLPY